MLLAGSLVKASLCRRCLVQVSFVIGLHEPHSITVFNFGSGVKSAKELTEIVNKNFLTCNMDAL